MMMRTAILLFASVVLSMAAGCGSSPPPAPAEPKTEDSSGRPARTGPMPQMSQELGSIDQRKVEQTFASLTNGPLESCHKQGRDRIEVLTGDVKVFLRIDASGKVRYGYFEDSTLGDRDTEKCILGAFRDATWPKPDGGEAEVRSGFGWGPGGEREPSVWSSDKVTGALGDAKDVKRAVERCKSGVKGDFKATAYVEEVEAADPSGTAAPAPVAKPKPKGKPGAVKHAEPVKKEAGGRFKAIGISPPNKEGAEKVDCLVDAIRALDLPSPGSYPAKVSFSL